MATEQRRSAVAVVSIIAAIASFFPDFALWRFLLAIVAVLLGVVGFLMAASPRVSGGILSIIAIVLGIAAIIAALFEAVIF